MENYVPPIENLPTREAVIDSLKSNPGDKTLLNAYRDDVLEKESGGFPTVESEMEIARIYREAGLLKEALGYFDDAWIRMRELKEYNEKTALQEELQNAIWDLEDELGIQG